MRALLKIAALGTGILASGPAWADSVIYAVPTNWRLQNYIGTQGIVAWFTGSSCGNGALNLSSSSTSDERNRFWTLVLTAKVSGKAVGVYYETATGTCQITSFYMDQ
jgi:hypothetical protein